MRITPRDYQQYAVNSIWDYFEKGGKGNPLVGMPTGTGKSVVIAAFLQSIYAQYPMQRVMVLTHVKELIEQNYLKLINMWPTAPAGIYSAGLKRRDVDQSIIFAGIGSVAKRPEDFANTNLIIIDEAHLVSPNDGTMYRKFIAALKEHNPKLKVIGFTATMWRLKQGSLIEDDGLFTDVCFDMTTTKAFNWLVSEGYLMPLIAKSTTTELLVDDVHMRGGEFIAKELQMAVDKNEITYSALKEAIEMGADRHSWLVFTTGIEHCMNTNAMLNSLGIDSKPVHGGNKEYQMTSKERDANIADLKAGRIRAVVNNNVLTTGFDHPEIDFIIMLRPTASAGLWVQMLGRGTRPVYESGYDLTTIEGRLESIANSQKQNTLVADFAGNTKRLGPINDPLLPNAKRKKGKPGTAPVKVCEACDCYVHASARVCEYCGSEFLIQSRLHETASTDEVMKMDLPVVEVFNVGHVTYNLHQKAGKPDSIKVSYVCGLQMFTEYVCLEHGGFIANKAADWWKERDFTRWDMYDSGEMDAKELTTKRALELAQTLRIPDQLHVWVNKKYPEIMSYTFSKTPELPPNPDDFADDIPF